MWFWMSYFYFMVKLSVDKSYLTFRWSKLKSWHSYQGVEHMIYGSVTPLIRTFSKKNTKNKKSQFFHQASLHF